MPAAAKRKPEPIVCITRNEVLMGRERQTPLTPELEANLGRLLGALNQFRTARHLQIRPTKARVFKP